jgi:hypothetical protein
MIKKIETFSKTAQYGFIFPAGYYFQDHLYTGPSKKDPWYISGKKGSKKRSIRKSPGR